MKLVEREIHGSLDFLLYDGTKLRNQISLALLFIFFYSRNGSSCTTMAESLRTMLKADFKSATGVHIGQTKPSDFRKTIDANWNWLDGKSLLPS